MSDKNTNTPKGKSQSVDRRAVHIAATVMDAAGLCRYESPRQCRKAWPPSRETCVKCIENWLLAKARKELQDA